MNYLKQVSFAALLVTSAICLTSCKNGSALSNSSPVSSPIESETIGDTKMTSIDEALSQDLQEIHLLVGQELMINQISQASKWRVSVSRHDFPKILIETDEHKTQRKMSFKTSGQFRISVRSEKSTNSQSGTAPNIIQRQITVIVKDK